MRLLQGIRVIELGGGIAGSYATKMFADYGAEVIKVEPPEGDSTRHMAPYIGDEEGINRSTIFLHTNTGKKSIVLDLDAKPARGLLKKLIASADIVIESFKPGTLAGIGLGYEDLVKVQPRLVLTSITAFGQDGPYAGYEGSELIYYGMGGPMLGNGTADREPLKLGGYMQMYQTGNVAALATLSAYLLAEEQDTPTHVDVSGFEVGLTSPDRRTTFLVNYAFTGASSTRGDLLGGILPNGAFPTADGYVQIMLTQAWLPRMLATVQDPDMIAYFTEVAANPALFPRIETKEALDAGMYPWLLERTKEAVMEEGQANKWPVTAINSPDEVIANKHFAARGFFHTADYPDVGEVTHVGAPFQLHDGWDLAPAPALGADTDAVLSSL